MITAKLIQKVLAEDEDEQLATGSWVIEEEPDGTLWLGFKSPRLGYANWMCPAEDLFQSTVDLFINEQPEITCAGKEYLVQATCEGAALFLSRFAENTYAERRQARIAQEVQYDVYGD